MQLGKHDVPWLPLHALWEPINFRHFWATTALKTVSVVPNILNTYTHIFHCLLPGFADSAADWIHYSATCARFSAAGSEAKKGGGKVELHTVSASAQIRRRIGNSVGLTDCSCVHSAFTTPEWLRRGCLKTLTHTRSLRSCLFLRCLI